MRQMGHGVRRANIQLSAQKLKPNAQYSAQAVVCSQQQFPTRVCWRSRQRNTIKMSYFTSAPQGNSCQCKSMKHCYPQYWTCIILWHYLLYLRIQSWEVLAAVPFSVECFRAMSLFCLWKECVYNPMLVISHSRVTRTISIGLPSFYSVEQTVTVPSLYTRWHLKFGDRAFWFPERPTFPLTPSCVESFDTWSRGTPAERPLRIFTVNSPSKKLSLPLLHQQWPPFRAIT